MNYADRFVTAGEVRAEAETRNLERYGDLDYPGDPGAAAAIAAALRQREVSVVDAELEVFSPAVPLAEWEPIVEEDGEWSPWAE